MTDEHHEIETHEGHAEGGYFDILTDGSHLAVELTFEGFFLILTLLLNALLLKMGFRKRDKAHSH